MADTGTSQAQTISLAARFEALRGTKVYDLLAAAPLIAWYGVCVAKRFPELARYVTATDWGTADIATISSIACSRASFFSPITLYCQRHG